MEIVSKQSLFFSNYYHKRVNTLGLYKGMPFVTGSYDYPNSKKTEILDYSSKKWNEVADYPFTEGPRFVCFFIWTI